MRVSSYFDLSIQMCVLVCVLLLPHIYIYFRIARMFNVQHTYKLCRHHQVSYLRESQSLKNLLKKIQFSIGSKSEKILRLCEEHMVHNMIVAACVCVLWKMWTLIYVKKNHWFFRMLTIYIWKITIKFICDDDELWIFHILINLIFINQFSYKIN